MDIYTAVKTLHIISATVLFGTGLGIAFFLVRSHFTSDMQERYFAARTTVLADWCFTLPAGVLQPVTGGGLLVRGGYDWDERWLVLSYALYLLAGLCWLPVVVIQIRLRDMLRTAAQDGKPLPHAYHRLFQAWFALGWPAFIGLVIVFFLMVAKPA
jgi:uncharacterized membrane protein